MMPVLGILKHQLTQLMHKYLVANDDIIDLLPLMSRISLTTYKSL